MAAFAYFAGSAMRDIDRYNILKIDRFKRF